MDPSPQKQGLNEQAIQQLGASLRGTLIQPGEPDYDAARKVYNAMIDRRPRLIARCVDVADVITAVHFAREQGLLLAVRGGGHNGGGLGVCDDGLVHGPVGDAWRARRSAEARTVRVAGGCTWGDVDHATHAVRARVPAGSSPPRAWRA